MAPFNFPVIVVKCISLLLEACNRSSIGAFGLSVQRNIMY